MIQAARDGLLLAFAAGVFSARAAPAQGVSDRTRCIGEYVLRGAYLYDFVCVTPETRARVVADNAQARVRVQPGGGAYGPDTCRPGWVWREAIPSDHVCVTPATRSQTAADNAQVGQRRAFKGDLLPGGAVIGGAFSEFMGSASATYSLVMQKDCNLVLYNPEHRVLWASDTDGRGAGCYAEMQTDGNLVVYSSGRRPVWASATEGHPGAYLVVQDDGNVVIYQGLRPLWATHTDPEILTDQCKGDVFVSRKYDPPYHPSSGMWNGYLMSRARADDSNWSPTMEVDERRIRWWCNSATGNWADPGTWRLREGYVEVGCAGEQCGPQGGRIRFTDSSVGGWTPERSRCPSTTRRVSARLGPYRAFYIRCYR